MPGEMQATVSFRAVTCACEIAIVQEGLPAAIPVEMCYLGWQESLAQLALLVEPEIPDGAYPTVRRHREGSGPSFRRLHACLATCSSAGLSVIQRISRTSWHWPLERAEYRKPLKTPVTSIRLLAETLRLKRARDVVTADRLLETISDESDRLGRLVDNVLCFSQVEKGARRYHPVSIDAAEAANQAVSRFQYIL